MNDIEKAIRILKYYRPVGALNAGFKEPQSEDMKAFNLAISALEKQIPKKVIYDYGLNETRCPECKTIFGYAEEGEDDES